MSTADLILHRCTAALLHNGTAGATTVGVHLAFDMAHTWLTRACGRAIICMLAVIGS